MYFALCSSTRIQEFRAQTLWDVFKVPLLDRLNSHFSLPSFCTPSGSDTLIISDWPHSLQSLGFKQSVELL